MGNFFKKLFGKKSDNVANEQKIELEKRTEFYKNFASDGELCFDVGANIGNRIEPLLAIGAKIIAIEPQESCYNLLKEKFGNKITIVTDGIGAEEGEKDFYISNASTISSFSEDFIEAVKDGRFKEYEWNESVRVKMTTLDSLIEKYGQPVFIKIDVEGYEPEVLKGLSHPIKYLSFEYTVPEQTHKAIECIKRLETIRKDVEFNYSVGESMELAMTKWLNTDEMCALVKSSEFAQTDFGDIYARNIN